MINTSPSGPQPSIGELLDALDTDEIRASYRPVVHLATGAVVGWEAVGRWDHPRRGVLRREAFADLATEADATVAVEAVVLHAALAALATFDGTDRRSRPTMSVPFGLPTLATGRVASMVADALQHHRVAPHRLFVEVSGPVPADAIPTLAEHLEDIRRLGVKITLSDVACGDTSFTRLRTLPLDRLQLGRCCTSAVDRPREQAIVRAVVALARDLNLDVIADGVDSPSHDRVLRRLGCSLGSGTIFGEFGPYLHRTNAHDTPLRGRRTHPVPGNEVSRLAMVYETGLLDSAPEAEFDRLAADAARACDAPLAMVNLVDVDRVFVKASFGPTNGREIDRSMAFCAHTICTPDPMVVPDTLEDPRFARNPLVQPLDPAEPALRFYAGVPLVSSDGITLGTVCVLDHRRRDGLTTEQLDTLVHLASLASNRCELRARLHQLDRTRQAAAAADRAVEELRQLITLETPMPPSVVEAAWRSEVR
ncbi:MAG: EAL domain-containing protein [Acidimicrobiales bacterium]|nr:EAL domain-containing protein [Acidimicrobiales bacterium]MCB9393471.1 EAL domain-containing protein [Acidimicrobiaceae bacterium]